MIRKIDHLVLTTANLARCRAFYEAFGFSFVEKDSRYELRGPDFKINVHLAGQELTPHAARPFPGSVDICFETAVPLSEIRKIADARGFEYVLREARKAGFRGPMDSVYLRDPDGNLVEFCSYPDH